MIEEYRDIKDYEGLYQISNLGNVKSLRKNKILSTRINRYGYVDVHLYKDGSEKRCEIQRLVAQTFIPNPNNKEQVNHIDGNKTNNTVFNLEWTTPSENIKHAWNNGLKKIKNKESLMKQVKCIEDNLIFRSINEAAIHYGIHASNISMVCNGKLKTTGGKRFEFI